MLTDNNFLRGKGWLRCGMPERVKYLVNARNAHARGLGKNRVGEGRPNFFGTVPIQIQPSSIKLVYRSLLFRLMAGSFIQLLKVYPYLDKALSFIFAFALLYSWSTFLNEGLPNFSMSQASDPIMNSTLGVRCNHLTS